MGKGLWTTMCSLNHKRHLQWNKPQMHDTQKVEHVQKSKYSIFRYFPNNIRMRHLYSFLFKLSLITFVFNTPFYPCTSAGAKFHHKHRAVRHICYCLNGSWGRGGWFSLVVLICQVFLLGSIPTFFGDGRDGIHFFAWCWPAGNMALKNKTEPTKSQ